MPSASSVAFVHNSVFRKKSKEGPDFHPTPPWATRALLRKEKFRGSTWEPAAGDGGMADVLRSKGLIVQATDLHDYGNPKVLPGIDFLTVKHKTVRNIITNPPYNLAVEFLRRALELKPQKIALFCRTAWLEGRERGAIYAKRPPSAVWVFSQRVNFDDPTKPGGLISYSWFVWDKSHVGPPRLGWLNFEDGKE